MRKSIFRHLYVQVLVAALLGIVVGNYLSARPEDAGTPREAHLHQLAAILKFLPDVFLRLMKMMVAPIIFTSVVTGLAGMGNMRRVGRIGLKSLLYFEAMTTLALIIGWLVATTFQPGAGVNADLTKLDPKDLQNYVTKAHDQTVLSFLLNIIPRQMVGAFADGEIIQVLFISVIFGLALSSLGEGKQSIIKALNLVYEALMKMIAIIIKLAPLAAFGSMAFTISNYGLHAVLSLAKLLGAVYLTCLCFVIVCLGTLLWWNGISLWKFLRYIREEIFIVLGTGSSESVFPRMMTKMERLGCSKPVVGLVLPAGYTFNLDGSSIYLTFGALYIAQATNTHLTFWQELGVILVCLVTSKGAAAVVGSSFITLAATLAALGTIPVEGMLLIIAVDQLLASARATTNLIGNGTATIVIARWEKEFDKQKADEVLNSKTTEPLPSPAVEVPPMPMSVDED
jgi:aerobic C4-dicarboxylate transport protein